MHTVQLGHTKHCGLPFSLGNYMSPELEGSSATDGNSLKGTTLPWLGNLDCLNTHDDAYPLSIAGIMTALMLPSSANSISACIAHEMLTKNLTTYRYSDICNPYPKCFLNRLFKSITLFLTLVCQDDGIWSMSLALMKSEELTDCVLCRAGC